MKVAVFFETKAVVYGRLFQKVAPLSAHMDLQQPNQEVPLQEADGTFSQNSILSLTIDELHCKNGKSLGSMKMDEFFASIWNSDDNQPNLDDEAAKGKGVATETTIFQPQPQHNAPAPLLKRQPTLGEMSLEEFLVKAGVVKESSLLFNSSLPLNQIGLEPHKMLPQNSNLGESSGKDNKKRIIDGPPEVVVERRQRRMLKNRESAARSRARKQAYTVELEQEFNLLKEVNQELKQNLTEAESKRKQEIYQRRHTTMAQKRTEKMKAMKRHMSASW